MSLGRDGSFNGYARADGSVGCRNHTLVLAAMDSANPTVRRIGAMVPTVETVCTPYGRGQYGADGELTRRGLIGLASNPNVAACVIVSLEPVSAGEIAEQVAETGKPVEAIAIQEAGDTLRAAYEGARVAATMARDASRLRREPASLSKLRFGVECGGSDTTSGITSNALEYAKYILPKFGATIVESFSIPFFAENFSEESQSISNEVLLLGFTDVIQNFTHQIGQECVQ